MPFLPIEHIDLIPGGLRAIFFLSIIGIIITIISFFFNSDTSKVLRKVILVVSSMFILVLSVLNLSFFSESSYKATIVINIFLLLISLVMPVAVILTNDDKFSYPKHSVDKPVVNRIPVDKLTKVEPCNEEPIKEQNSLDENQKNDPEFELERLKRLFDNGIISKEEYELKRQKYVEML